MTTQTYSPDEGAEIELVGIDGAPLFNDDGSPMTWTVLGADSDIAVKARKDQQNRLYANAGRVTYNGDMAETDQVTYLAKLTTGWNLTPSKLVPGVDPGLGEGKVPFSAAAAMTILRNPKLSAIREQPNSAIAERARFMKAS